MNNHYQLSMLLVLILSSMAHADVRLPSIISNHMVLMKSPSAPIWGHADPGEDVRVTVGGKIAQARADAAGKWLVRLNLADCAAGPWQLNVRGKNDIAISDVMIGQVWLASGQSNMEFLLKFTACAKEEIAKSQNPLLRQFRVKKSARSQPQDDCEGAWTAATPDTAGEFSGVAYYFAKQLQRTLNVPVGIVNASWGGTYIEAWTSPEAIRTVESLRRADDERHKIAANYPMKKKAFVDAFSAWLTANDRQDKPTQNAANFYQEAASAGDWATVKLPGKVAGPSLPATGAIWIRKDIDIPASAIVSGQDFKVMVGQVEGFDQVYWNGKKVSDTPYQKYPGIGYSRYFVIPPELLRPGKTTIAIRIFAPVVSPSVSAPPTNFFAGAINLTGDWLAKAEYGWPALEQNAIAASPKSPTRPPGMMAGDIYNGVIHPLIPYAFSGVIWYQGESNAGRAYEYRTTFPLLINDWRQTFQQDKLPFYFCQLTTFGPKTNRPSESAWAELRESQSMALSLPNTGQAVLIDLGESADVHSRDKRTVGDRLARIALAKQYGKNCEFSGPVYQTITIEGARIRVKFSHIESGLKARPLPATYDVITKLGKSAPLVPNSPNSELEGFSICGPDHHWVWADAKIDGAAVMVQAPGVDHPVAVRYGWADDPTCNLYNGAGLPASPFRTDDFRTTTAKNHFDAGS